MEAKRWPGDWATYRAVNFTNKPGKTDAFTLAGLDAVTTRLNEVSAALRTAPGHAPGHVQLT